MSKYAVAAVTFVFLMGGAVAFAGDHSVSYIVASDGHLCPSETICSPVDAGEGSKAYLFDEHTEEGAGYIAIQVGPNPPPFGYVEFFPSSATIYHQTCAFTVGHTTQGYEWPVASQIEWYSSQPLGSRATKAFDRTKYAVTVKYRAQDLIPYGVYAFTFDCPEKKKNP